MPNISLADIRFRSHQPGPDEIPTDTTPTDGNLSLAGMKFRAQVPIEDSFPQGPLGPMLYTMYHENIYPDGPFPDDYTDYGFLATADGITQDNVIKEDPFHDQAYACWSPDYSKIVFMRADRQNVSSGSWPRGDLTPPIPGNPPTVFPSTSIIGATSHTDALASVEDTGDSMGVQEVWANFIPEISPDTTHIRGYDLFVGCTLSGGILSGGYLLRVQHLSNDHWQVSVIDMATSTTVWTNDFSPFSMTGWGLRLGSNGQGKIYFYNTSLSRWDWYGLSVSTPVHSGTYVGILNYSGVDGNWGGGSVESIPLLELCVMDADGSNETVLVSNIFSGASTISPNNQMVAYQGHSSEFNSHYGVSDIRVIDIDGTNDRSVIDCSVEIGDTLAGPISMIPTWTTDNQLVVYWIERDVSVTPTTYNTIEMRKYDPADGSYVVIWDVFAWAIAQGLDLDNFKVWGDGNVSLNNIHVVEISNRVPNGLTDGEGNQYLSQAGPYFALVECVESATPTIINTEDLPWKDWDMFTFQAQTGGFVPSFPSLPVLDDFNRSNGLLSSPWENNITNDLTISSNQLSSSRSSGSFAGMYKAVGPFEDCEVFITISNTNISTMGGVMIGARMTSPSTYDLPDGYLLTQSDNALSLYNCTGGAAAQITSLIPFIPSPGDVIGMRLEGSKLTVFVNGIAKIIRFDATAHTSGYLGAGFFTATGRTCLADNFGGGEYITPTPTYDNYQDIGDAVQVFWNAQGTEFMVHNEISTPDWGYRTWIAIALNPSTMESWSFAFSPNDPSTIPQGGTDSGYTEADTTPPYAQSSYIPTWYSDGSLVMSGSYNNPDSSANQPPDYTGTPGEPEDMGGFDGSFIDTAIKHKDGTTGWLAINRYPAGYETDTLYVSERMLISGIAYPTWYEDQTFG